MLQQSVWEVYTPLTAHHRILQHKGWHVNMGCWFWDLKLDCSEGAGQDCLTFLGGISSWSYAVGGRVRPVWMQTGRIPKGCICIECYSRCKH